MQASTHIFSWQSRVLTRYDTDLTELVKSGDWRTDSVRLGPIAEASGDSVQGPRSIINIDGSEGSLPTFALHDVEDCVM